MTKKILIFGLPGSGKTTLSNKLAKKLGCQHLNADQVRHQFNDWDFSDAGRERQLYRMLELSNSISGQYVILDFVCPLSSFRKKLSPDVIVYLDTIAESRYEDTNSIFEKPTRSENITYNFNEFNSDGQAQLIAKDLMTFDWRKPTVQMLGRWQPFHDGHVALFKRAIDKTGQVCIQVRDCQDWNNSNPFNFEQVKEGIIKKLEQNGFVEAKDYQVMLVPNIINITYGRDVGYKIEQESFDEITASISATEIRRDMGLE